MRGVKTLVLLLTTVFAATALSGCFGDSVTLVGQGVGGTKTGKASCPDGHGTISTSGQAAGAFSIAVYDADGVEIYDETVSSGQAAFSAKIRGVPGEWTVEVQNNGASQYSVTLSC